MPEEGKDPVIQIIRESLNAISERQGLFCDHAPENVVNLIQRRRQDTGSRPVRPDIFCLVNVLAEKTVEGEKLKQKISELLNTKKAEDEADEPPKVDVSTREYQEHSLFKRDRQVEIRILERILQK